MGCRSWAISLAIRAASTAFSATLLAATAFRRASAALLGPRDRDLSDFRPHHFIHALMPLPLSRPHHICLIRASSGVLISLHKVGCGSGQLPDWFLGLVLGCILSSHPLLAALLPLGPVVTLRSSSCRASSPPPNSVTHCWPALA